jgi:hypothetical protein
MSYIHFYVFEVRIGQVRETVGSYPMTGRCGSSNLTRQSSGFLLKYAPSSLKLGATIWISMPDEHLRR